MQKIDDSIVLFLQHHRIPVLTDVLTLCIPLEFWIVISIGIAALSFSRTKVLRFPLVSLVFANGFADYFCAIAKAFFHRPRPFKVITGALPVITAGGYSFPSGHATLAMAMAVVLAYHFPRTRALSYTLACLVGFSRVYFGVHYASDVIAGWFLGFVVGWLSIVVEKAVFSLAKGISFRKNPIP